MENRFCVRFRIEYVACSLAAILAQADVDYGQRERRGLHDAAAGVSKQQICVTEKTPVSYSAEVHEKSRVRMALKKVASSLHEVVTAGVRVGIAEQCLTVDSLKGTEEFVGLFRRVLQQSHGVVGNDLCGLLEFYV